MLNWRAETLNRFIAPGITAFVRAEIPDLRDKHPEGLHWVANHFLNNAVDASFVGDQRQIVANLIFRAQIAFERYHDARDATIAFLARGNPYSPLVRKYFESIASWETCLLNVQIFIALVRRLNGKDVYVSGDGSASERACELANGIKHWDKDIKNGIDDDYTIPIWLTNDGISSLKHAITYRELADLLDAVSGAANDWQDPRGYVRSRNEEAASQPIGDLPRSVDAGR